MTSIELIQIQGSRSVLVGDFNTSSRQLRLMDHLLRFKGPGPARDRTLVLEQRRHVGLLLYSIVSAAAAVTIIITLIVLFLAVLCPEHWLLTSSGDSQDKLLLLGILLSSSSVLISGLDGASLSNWTSQVLCSGLGCFMAWNIWTVQDDHPAVGSKHLALSMFAVTVFSVSGVSASLLTSNNPPVQFCLSSILILCCNICTLSWLFGPKFLCTWPKSSELQSEAAEDEDDNKDEDEDQVNSLNQQLKSQSAQLDAEIEAINRELSAESAGPDPKLHHRTGERHHGEVRSVMWTHVVQVCSEDRNSERKPSSPDSINSPEHVGRRLSMQLPILHHSYLPAIGGVSASSSEAFVHSDLPMSPLTTSCTPESTIVLNQSDGSCD
ncbi:gamma-aminobutyric acid type B receptor subunit 2 isoform X2 [Larimichthys crocea]|uniref:gamma-aminobutyric acid type B receptor subunit 2 isoform X2 n=1 Tax=Larimichthys crocea TaxID=215358 RepID=UPI000F5FCC28|nr:gamma-aminobutyric acid type B receptor subunit 2 isoform X2 [Larimichthys crocea]